MQWGEKLRLQIWSWNQIRRHTHSLTHSLSRPWQTWNISEIGIGSPHDDDKLLKHTFSLGHRQSWSTSRQLIRSEFQVGRFRGWDRQWGKKKTPKPTQTEALKSNQKRRTLTHSLTRSSSRPWQFQTWRMIWERRNTPPHPPAHDDYCKLLIHHKIEVQSRQRGLLGRWQLIQVAPVLEFLSSLHDVEGLRGAVTGKWTHQQSTAPQHT